MDNFNIHKFFKDQYLAEAEGYHDPNHPVEKLQGNDTERKMALRNVIDVLGKHYPELTVDDKLDFVTAHAKDFFNGNVDPYNEDEIKDEYQEYFTFKSNFI